MAASDVSALLDVASSPDQSSTTTIETVPEPAADILDEGATSSETADTGAGATETSGDAGEKVDARTNPDAIRKVLKSIRDSSPENAPIARQLNNIVGREQAYRQVFSKVADAKNAKFLLDSIGGGDGLSTLQATIKSVNETDALLYAGDPKVLDTILKDMKAAGKLDAFGKLASPFLEKLRATDEKAYFSALRPHFYRGIVDSGLPDVLDGLEAALSAQADGKSAPNVETIKALVAEMRKWYSALDKSAKTTEDPDLKSRREAFEQEKTAFQGEKQKAFQGEVHGEWNRANNQALGEALKPFLKLPFAKNWTDKTKHSVAREITSTLISELSADKAYQAQMDAFWSAEKPDKAKIVEFHKSKLGLVAKRIVQQVLEDRYPGFSSVKGATTVKTDTTKQAAPAKPIYQATKPSQDQVDWDKDPNQLLYITGRFYLKGDRSGALRTWNQKYK